MSRSTAKWKYIPTHGHYNVPQPRILGQVDFIISVAIWMASTNTDLKLRSAIPVNQGLAASPITPSS
ncbi:MAG TPA: hypothetical protein VK155_18500 [Bacteroidales bacterium]|nr:hypothetical protein [Bacteroidales bacterium]